MKILKDILYKVQLEQAVGSTRIEVSCVCFDSRKVKSNALFVAVKGTQVDGHNFIEGAIATGATAIICEHLPEILNEKITYIRVNNSAQALGIIAGNFHENPSTHLKLIGITGTNGKTSTVTLLFQLLRAMGKKTGMLSTVENRINDQKIKASHTTPDAIQLNELLKKMVQEGCEFCIMEVSSHAIEQHRIHGLDFQGGIFTNLSHDHLDYHKTFKEYLLSKKKFFDQLPGKSFALTNADDRNGKVMLQNCKAKKYFYGLKTPADFKGKILEKSFDGLILTIDGLELHSGLIGEFNGYNLLTAYSISQLIGLEKMEALRILSSLNAPAGRFDYLLSKRENVVGIVDYAHTPDALLKVMQSIKGIRTGTENVISIVGCGGDRDSGKRPIMAKVACDFSDRVILTSDNPRSENPETIIQDMEAGVNASNKKKVLTIINRREAIKTACMLANKCDIILLAGKGHEKYQEIRGVKHPFDDKEILRETLRELDK